LYFRPQIMEKKGMLEQKNSKVYVQHAVMEKQIMTDMRHRNIVQVSRRAPPRHRQHQLCG
jgi:hypothetical protein